MTDSMVYRTLRIPMGTPTGPEGRPLYGWQEVPAYCLSGLAVHKSLKGSRWRWMVTHEASGMKLDRIGAMTKAQAVENMRAALALDFDWTLPERETLDALRKSRGIVAAITAIGNRD